MVGNIYGGYRVVIDMALSRDFFWEYVTPHVRLPVLENGK